MNTSWCRLLGPGPLTGLGLVGMTLLVLPAGIVGAGPTDVVASHDAANPVYHVLRTTGVRVTDTDRLRLPAPTLPDGLDSAAQQAAVRAVLGEDYTAEEFVRDSVVAPFVLKIRDLTPSDPQAPARGVDVWFVTAGDLGLAADTSFLGQLTKKAGQEGKGAALTPAELAKRNITVRPGDTHESYGRVEFQFLDRVDIAVTGRGYWTRTGDSLLTAAEVDPRFADDPDFPNRWRAVSKDGDGVRLGPPVPYRGGAQYLKVTRLADPPGMLFAEYHLILVEPQGWFDGANFLRSKLPPAVQKLVRDFRRELAKAKGR